MSSPKIAIALAAYRPDPLHFAEQLQSILNQTERDWVCIITLDSDEPIERPSDPRLRWYPNPIRLGATKNFERAIGLAAATGAGAIACADQDDRWYPEKLAILYAALACRPPGSLVHSDKHVLTADDQTLSRTVWQLERRATRSTTTWGLLIRNVVAGCAMMMDARLARDYPVIPPGPWYHDHWYALLATTRGGVYAIDQPLLAYRQHSRSTLGVTPYAGFLSIGGHRGNVTSALIEKFERSHDLFLALQRDAGPRPWRERVAWNSLIDCGLALFLSVPVAFFRRDPALARATLARSIGKSLGLIKRLKRSLKNIARSVFIGVDKLTSPRRSSISSEFPGQAPNGLREKLALFAHYSTDGSIADYVLLYLAEIQAAGFEIQFVSTAPHLTAESVARVAPFIKRAVCRQNVGLDFGSWKVGLQGARPLRQYQSLLLANDSVIGPLHPLTDLFEQASQVDAFGITDCLLHRPHLQSYFLHFNLRGPALTHVENLFESGFRYLRSKISIVHRYEIGFSSRLISDPQVRWCVAYSHSQLLQGHRPTGSTSLDFAPELLERGDPLIKKEFFLNHPEFQSRIPVSFFKGLLK